MNAKELKRIIENEIGDRWSETNLHGVDLRECLVEPRLVSVRNTFPFPDRPKPRTLDLWLVLEETPGIRDGYLILYNHDSDQFGLGSWGEGDEIVFLGYHGSFWSTFEGM